MGWPQDNDQIFNQNIANKFTKVTVPLSGNCIYLSGASPQNSSQLLTGAIYTIVSTQDFHAIASHDQTMSASRNNLYWLAGMPLLHIPLSGASEYVSVYATNGGTIEAWLAITNFTIPSASNP